MSESQTIVRISIAKKWRGVGRLLPYRVGYVLYEGPAVDLPEGCGYQNGILPGGAWLQSLEGGGWQEIPPDHLKAERWTVVAAPASEIDIDSLCPLVPRRPGEAPASNTGTSGDISMSVGPNPRNYISIPAGSGGSDDE